MQLFIHSSLIAHKISKKKKKKLFNQTSTKLLKFNLKIGIKMMTKRCLYVPIRKICCYQTLKHNSLIKLVFFSRKLSNELCHWSINFCMYDRRIILVLSGCLIEKKLQVLQIHCVSIDHNSSILW